MNVTRAYAKSVTKQLKDRDLEADILYWKTNFPRDPCVIWSLKTSSRDGFYSRATCVSPVDGQFEPFITGTPLTLKQALKYEARRMISKRLKKMGHPYNKMKCTEDLNGQAHFFISYNLE